MAETKSYTYCGPGKHLHFDPEGKRHVLLKPGDKADLTEDQARAWADRFQVDRSLLGGSEDGHAIRSTEPGAASGAVVQTPQEREELAKVEREAEEAKAMVFERSAKEQSAGPEAGSSGGGSESGSSDGKSGGKK